MFSSSLLFHRRSPSCRRALLPLGLMATLAACTDGSAPLDPPAREEPSSGVEVQTLTCTADVRSGAVSCAPADEPKGSADGLSRIVLNPEGSFARFITSNASYTDELYTFDAAVQNRTRQTLGVTEAGRVDRVGVRVFFSRLPVATEGSGAITVNGAETGRVTADGQVFYRYRQTLAPDETSQPRQWSFTVPATVIRFTFSVLVAASVQYPQGWMEITGGPSLRLARNGTRPLSAVVLDSVGRDITARSAPITWSVADSSVAALSGSTLTGAALAGYTTVTATSGARSATAWVLVGRPYIQITAGQEHSCGLGPDGRAECWGLNSRGELGDKSYTQRNTPVAVAQGPVTYAHIAAGGSHTCAATTTRRTWCWGSNAAGQLGDGTSATERSSPVAVLQGTDGYLQIAGGAQHTCVRSDAEKTYCWGSNIQGQLGDNTLTSRNRPAGLENRSGTHFHITAGTNHSCALVSTGLAYCWGGNAYGQIGDGTTTPRLMPVALWRQGRAFVRIAAGAFHTCGLTSAGQAYCWGLNQQGQLGDGTTTTRLLAVAVSQPTPFVEIVQGAEHGCGLSSTGQTYCWGGNQWGQLGDETTANRLTPVAVDQRGVAYVQIAAGARHTCGRTARGQTFCWGRNSGGQIGDNTTSTRLHPVAVR